VRSSFLSVAREPYSINDVVIVNLSSKIKRVELLLFYCTRALQLWSRRDLMTLGIRGQLPASNIIGQLSRNCHAGCQLLCLRMSHVPLDTTARHIGMSSDRHKLATAHFDVWNSNEELTRLLHSYFRTGASYVTFRAGDQ
jgi:hypothetical protein